MIRSLKVLRSIAILCMAISSANIITAACTSITSLPYTITAPGDYCLGLPDLLFEGPGNAITVSSNDVNIDLQGYTLRQTGTTDGTNGIYVNPYLSNVNVFNGSVNGFTYTNIWYDAGNNAFEMHDLLVANCIFGQGIWLGPEFPTTDPSQIGSYVSNVTLRNCSMLSNGNALVILGNENIYVDTIHCDDSFADGAFIQGISPRPLPDDSLQEQVFLKNLQIYNSTFNRGAGFGQSGLFLSQVVNPYINGCSFNNNVLSGIFSGASAGLLCGAIVNGLIEDCQFNDNTWNPDSDIPFLFEGFHSSANSRGGLRDAQRITVRNCEAKRNIAPGFTGGIYVGYQENIVLENNIASNNISLALQPDPTTGTIGGIPCCSGICIDGGAGGFLQANNIGTVSNLVVRNNITNNNIAEQGLGAGIYILGGNFFTDDVIEDNFVFHDNIAQGNAGLADSPPIGDLFVPETFDGVQGIGAGILVDRGVILSVDNLRLGSGLFPAKAYRNLSIIGNTFQGNVCGAAGADAWSPLVPYNPDDAVSFEKTVYQSLQNNNLNNQPNTSPEFWQALLPATGSKYSGGLVLIGVDAAAVLDNDATGNTNGFVLTGGKTWAGQEIASSSNVLVQNNEAVKNTHIGFWDAHEKSKRSACNKVCSDLKFRNAFVKNTAFNNRRNFKLAKDANIRNISIPCDRK